MKISSRIMLSIILTIVSIPFVTHNQIYQTLLTTPDGLVHTKVLDDYRNGLTPNILYPAQAVFGVVLSYLAVFFNVSSQTMFLAFMGVVLATALWSIYYVITKLVGVEAGYIAVLLGLFRINSILAMFTYAVAFNLIDMYIILPFAILFIVKWLAGKKRHDLVFGLVLVGIFSGLHVVAIYIPYIIVTALVGLEIYKLVTHNHIRRFVITGLLIAGVNLVVSLPLIGHQIIPLTQGMSGMVQQTVNGGLFKNLYILIMMDVTPLVILIGVLATVVLFAYRIELTDSQKYLLVIFGMMALVIIGAGILGSSFVPDRQIMDGSIYLSLLVSVIIGILWQNSMRFPWLITWLLVLTGMNVINTGVAWVK